MSVSHLLLPLRIHCNMGMGEGHGREGTWEGTDLREGFGLDIKAIFSPRPVCLPR